MNLIDNDAIKRHSAVRFRSEYHYAVFEYWRSAKLLQWLRLAGIEHLGHVLDDGCGGGGMCVSLGEETDHVVGIDLNDRFRDAGTRLAQERGVNNVTYVRADGCRLPFPDRTFDTVLSHAVIEHISDYGTYLHEARRVMRSDGHLFLQTAPYLSPHGSHIPRLKIPIPLHLIIGRRAAFAVTRWIAAHRPTWFHGPPEGSSFLTAARLGKVKIDDVLYFVTVRNLRQAIRDAGFRIVREDLHVSGLVRRYFPKNIHALVPGTPLARDILITNMEYLLVT